MIFRLSDLALGGQGAPLAPLVDLDLLKGYDYYGNFGGICNISTLMNGGRMVAGDIAACNQALNYIAQKLGQEFDDNGLLAAQGVLIEELKMELNSLPFHQLSFPKSLDNGWILSEVFPLLDPHLARPKDVLHTLVHYIVDQVEAVVKAYRAPAGQRKLLCSGGGAKNGFLMQELAKRLEPHQVQVVVPDHQLIDFKESLLMAYMAYCFLQRRRNILHTVTGSKRDSVGGCLHVFGFPTCKLDRCIKTPPYWSREGQA